MLFCHDHLPLSPSHASVLLNKLPFGITEVGVVMRHLIASFLTPRVHLLLRRHGIRSLLLGGLLLLQVGLVLQGLLLIGSHVGLLRLVARHALLWHALGHRRRCGLLLFW